MSYIVATHITNEVLGAILASLVTSLSENGPRFIHYCLCSPSTLHSSIPLASPLESPLPSLALAFLPKHLRYSRHVCSFGLRNPGLSFLGTLGKAGFNRDI